MVEIDLADLRNREAGLMEVVVFHSCQIAAERFNPDPADPGWNAEMHEDLLRDAVIGYADAIKARREAESGKGT